MNSSGCAAALAAKISTPGATKLNNAKEGFKFDVIGMNSETFDFPEKPDTSWNHI